ncbi:sigma-70 family RNA polymerase sigma factor [Haliangium ochraceum]|uniref:RNA polymerase, sigma-24 subunit, ECF subfamily n=1 Tax=Haliangium ochraceum (strain DSM 14365 / JCM 11303 / SMP-2) TaxID=502025 RepID=D0LGP0_HALO1|nr:sigma-70 family RNA polymerase sigma factor [Haliangium ochraceum]ACY12786.1 RNA polymerase, sigma-24 subunit, ECF subfamily [Haliangium ochraceum DSM 14365]
MSRRERALIRKLRDRDERAFRELVTQFGDRIFNLTFRMLGSREEAEDISQEVFITVFKSIDSFRGDAKFSTWMYRIAVNHCKNRIKYLARRHDRSRDEYDDMSGQQQAAGATAVPSTPARPDLQLEGVQLEQIMQRCIASLDEEHRVLIVLRDIEDLSYEEICTITNLPTGTVKSRLHRARLALRKKMLTKI